MNARARDASMLAEGPHCGSTKTASTPGNNPSDRRRSRSSKVQRRRTTMTNYNRVLGCAAILSVAIVSAYSQEPEREMTCDNGWQNDLVSLCEINEMTIAAQPGLSVDGGVNGGMTVKGWKRNEILVRARVETAAA